MLRRSLVVLGLVVAFASMSVGQTNSNTATVALSATVGSSITISPIAAVSFGAVTPGNATNNASTSATVSMSWNLAPSHTALKLYAFFSSSTAALTDGATPVSNIPSSAVQLKATTATGTNNIASFTPVTGTNAGFGAAGASLLVKTVNISGANKVTASDTTTLDFNLDLSALSTLAAGTYNGTLNIQAQATP